MIDYTHAAALGLIEGLTEFLPVSSTGHLIVLSDALGITALHKQAADAYAIIIQIGAILAVVALYPSRILQLVHGAWHLPTLLRSYFFKQPAHVQNNNTHTTNQTGAQGSHLLLRLATAFFPAAAIGLLVDDFLTTHLFNPTSVAIALLVGSVFMLFAGRQLKKNQARRAQMLANSASTHVQTQAPTTIETLTFKQATVIGLCQCAALWPGFSRSMATLAGGAYVGLNAKQAAEFSFLLGLLTLSAAAGYRLVSHWSVLSAQLTLGPALLGIAVAFMAAALSVRFLVSILTRFGFGPFIIYRIALAAVILLFLA